MQNFRVIPIIKLENDTQQLNVEKQYREIHLLRERKGGGGGEELHPMLGRISSSKRQKR